MNYGYVFNTLWLRCKYQPHNLPNLSIRNPIYRRPFRKQQSGYSNSRWASIQPSKIWNAWRKPALHPQPNSMNSPAFVSPLVWQSPGGMEDYVHRIGRTGRAGRQGLAVSWKVEKGVFWFVPWEVTVCKIGWFLFCNAWLVQSQYQIIILFLFVFVMFVIRQGCLWNYCFWGELRFNMWCGIEGGNYWIPSAYHLLESSVFICHNVLAFLLCNMLLDPCFSSPDATHYLCWQKSRYHDQWGFVDPCLFIAIASLSPSTVKRCHGFWGAQGLLERKRNTLFSPSRLTIGFWGVTWEGLVKPYFLGWSSLRGGVSRKVEQKQHTGLMHGIPFLSLA